jgi:hypothetical protein
MIVALSGAYKQFSLKNTVFRREKPAIVPASAIAAYLW